jgi:hypothetical protein
MLFRALRSHGRPQLAEGELELRAGLALMP